MFSIYFKKLSTLLPSLTRRQYVLLAGLAMALLVSAILAWPNQTQNNHADTSKGGAPSAERKAAEPEVTSAAPATTPTNNSTPQPAAPAAKKVASTPTKTAIDFSFDTAYLEVIAGQKTPTVTATANQKLAWMVGATPRSAILTTLGSTHGKDMTATHQFNLGTDVQTKPGTYSVSVTGYLPRGASVTKNISLIVKPRPTFKLVPYIPIEEVNTETIRCASFGISSMQPLLPEITSATAKLRATSNSSFRIEKVETYGGAGCVLIAVPDADATGHIQFEVTASDGTYTTTVNFSYDIPSYDPDTEVTD